MAPATPLTAFILPSGPEMVVLLIVGIMLFGRRLPEVGRTVGRTIVHLRQGLYKLKAEMDMDGDLRDMAETFRETKDQLTRVTDVPRKLANPGKVLQDLTDEGLAALGDDTEEVPDSIFAEVAEVADPDRGIENSATQPTDRNGAADPDEQPKAADA